MKEKTNCHFEAVKTAWCLGMINGPKDGWSGVMVMVGDRAAAVVQKNPKMMIGDIYGSKMKEW